MRSVVTATRRPHKWKRCGANWKCAPCRALAAEFDDNGQPEPYGMVYYRLMLVELTCEELTVCKVMDC